MKVRLLVAAGLLAASMTPALANNCPVLMDQVDALLAEEGASLNEDTLARVQELRAEGEALHEQGDHDGSVAALEEALSMFGQ